LFCRCCNCKRQVSAPNSQAGQNTVMNNVVPTTLHFIRPPTSTGTFLGRRFKCIQFFRQASYAHTYERPSYNGYERRSMQIHKLDLTGSGQNPMVGFAPRRYSCGDRRSFITDRYS
jgi:hypothetical protein